MADGGTLMSTRQYASVEKLAELTCAQLKGKRRARVLIGGWLRVHLESGAAGDCP
jgi:hypothetical protein